MTPSSGWFRTTMWTVVERAKEGDRSAFDALVEQYRLPVIKYLQTQGCPGQDAEDLAQDIFLRIYEKDVLVHVDSSKGRFRRLLMAVSRNVVKETLRNSHALKRGGSRTTLSLDGALTGESASTFAEALTAPEDEHFNRLWAWNLLGMAFGKLHQECRERGTPAYDVLHSYVTGGVGIRYEDIATELSITVEDVTNHLHAGRKLLKRHIMDAIRDYSLSPEEYAEESEALRPYLE